MKLFRKGKNSKIKPVESESRQLAKPDEVENNKDGGYQEALLPEVRIPDQDSLKKYVLELKNQIQEAMNRLERLKKEHRTVTEYLNDVQVIEGFLIGEEKELYNTANVIIHLRKDRKAYQEDTNRLDDSVYLKMSQYEEEMPGIIRKLGNDEMYVSRIKSEIDNLEGDKGVLQYEKQEVLGSHRRNLKLSIVVMTGFLITFIILLVSQLVYGVDTQIGILFTGICAAIVTLGIFIRYNNNMHQAAKSGYGLNKLIDKQNKVKARYVSAARGLEYAYTKYNVHSASELLYRWERYEATKAARENYRRTGRELQSREEKLVDLLKTYQIKDTEIWLKQVEYLVNPKVMREVHGQLIKQREEMKEQMGQYCKDMQSAKDAISLLVNQYPQFIEEIMEWSQTSQSEMTYTEI